MVKYSVIHHCGNRTLWTLQTFFIFWTMAFKTCGCWFPTLELEKTVIWNLQDLHCWVKTFHLGFILRALILLPIALIPRPLGSFRSAPLPTGKGFECAEW